MSKRSCPFLLAGLLSNPVIVNDDGSFRESYFEHLNYDCLEEDCMVFTGDSCGMRLER